MNFDVQDHEKGEFNSGLAIIYRLDTIHKVLHNARANRDVEILYAWLISFFVEMSRVIKMEAVKNEAKAEIVIHKGYWDKVKKSYFEIKRLKKIGKDIPAGLYDDFTIWEIELTLIEQKYNLGMPKKADAGRSLK